MDSEIEMNNMKMDWLILADGAQVNGGKLYVLGGGWDKIVVQQPFPRPHTMAIAAGVRVPWNQANVRHRFKLAIVDGDGVEELWKAEGEFEVGRAVGSIPGQDQRFQVALTFSLELKKEGSYTAALSVNGEQLGHTPFYVMLTPAMRALAERRQKGA